MKGNHNKGEAHLIHNQIKLYSSFESNVYSMSNLSLRIVALTVFIGKSNLLIFSRDDNRH